MAPRVIVVGAGRTAEVLTQALAGGWESARIGYGEVGTMPSCGVVVLAEEGDASEGASPEQLLRRNRAGVRTAAEAAVRRAPGCILVVASRPVEAMALAALRASGSRRQRVLGAAAAAQSLRLAELVAGALDAAAEDVRAVVLGGCAQAPVALARFCSVGGVPATELIAPDAWARLAAQADAGPDALAAGAAALARAILSGRRRLLPCSVYLEGEYGVDGVFLGVPAILGASGLERILQLNLKIEERAALQKAAAIGRAWRAMLEEAE